MVESGEQAAGDGEPDGSDGRGRQEEGGEGATEAAREARSQQGQVTDYRRREFVYSPSFCSSLLQRPSRFVSYDSATLVRSPSSPSLRIISDLGQSQ